MKRFALEIARIAHEANRVYCASLGDYSQPEWSDAPAWMKDSAVLGVEAIIRDPHMTPEQSHESWLRHKQSEGWIYGPTKDPKAKMHPCMVPYNDLPLEQRAKDSLFGDIVRSLLNALRVGGYIL